MTKGGNPIGRLFVFHLIVAFVLFVMTGCDGESTPQYEIKESSETEQVSATGSPLSDTARAGDDIFASNCAVCHGADGEGQPDWHITKADGTLPPPPLNGDGHTWHHGDGLLYRIVSQGGAILEDPRYSSFKSGMPAFGDRLSHEEIIAVLTYIKSLWGDKIKLGRSIRESQGLASEQDPFPSDGG